jgi:hypothetical protein
MKRVTPELLQVELKKLNVNIEMDYSVSINKETKLIDNRINEMQKGL